MFAKASTFLLLTVITTSMAAPTGLETAPIGLETIKNPCTRHGPEWRLACKNPIIGALVFFPVCIWGWRPYCCPSTDGHPVPSQCIPEYNYFQEAAPELELLADLGLLAEPEAELEAAAAAAEAKVDVETEAETEG